MDIDPRLLKATGNTTSLQTPKAQDLSELSLKQGSTYKAEILKQLPESTSPKVHLTLTDANKALGQDLQQAQNLLLKLNGKLLEVSTRAALAKGQTITLKLEPNNIKSNALTLTGVQNLTTHSTSTLKNLNAQSSSQLILSQLSKLLTQQIGLQKGFSLLDQATETSTKNSTSPLIQGKLDASVKSLSNNLHTVKSIIDSLENVRSNTSTNSVPSADPAAQLIKQALTHSGLFLERSLSSKEGATSLQQLLREAVSTMRMAESATPGNSGQHSTNQPSNQAPTQASTQTPQTSNNITEQLMQLLGKANIASTSSSSNSSLTPEPKSDLKALLIKLSAHLSASLRNTTNAAASSTTPFDIIDERLATRPFEFPKTSSQSTSKAQAILADKELNLGQLLKIMASMLNRIQFNQLNSLFQSQQVDNIQTQSWFFELPLLNQSNTVDVFSLRIDQRKEDKDQETHEKKDSELQWKLSLSFDLDELGPLYIQVVLTPPSVSSVIWAEKQPTYELAQKETNKLREKLSMLGLEVGDIHCQQGLPSSKQTQITQSLVDIEA